MHYTLTMAVNQADIITLLREAHLFRNFTDDQLAELADQFEAVHIADKQVIHKCGARSDSFCLIFEGKVLLALPAKKGNRLLATLVRGDYFGEELADNQRSRPTMAIASGKVTLLKLSTKKFLALRHNYKEFNPNLRIALTSRRLVQQMRHKRLSFLNNDEVVYMMLRRHPFLLWTKIIPPLFALTVGLLILMGLFFYIKPFTVYFLYCGMIWTILLLAVTLWFGIDWSNDYFLVTNQRVIWLERVVLIYDSRQEAPLNTIQSVSVNTSIWGRRFNFGDVVVKTFADTIPFTKVGRPYQVASMIEEYWGRSKVVSMQEESAAMDQSIRRRLGLLPPEEKKPPEKTPVKAGKAKKTSNWQSTFANLFRVRFQDQETVTYRKHWYVLLLNIWGQSLLLLILGGLWVAGLFKLTKFLLLSSWVFLFADLLIIGIIFLWWLYQYVDWSNDIYQVTPDQIIDIERKPLGRENKKTAPLDNILDIEYERTGLIGQIMNFGTVYINIGGIKFQFNNVFDPSQVQQDIFRRVAERKNKKRLAEEAKERERLAEWFAIYHRDAEDLRRQQQNPPT